MRIAALALAAGLWAGVATAQTDPATPEAAAATRAAALNLLAAVDTLAAARGAPDQVDALTRTITAHESALAALRAGLSDLDVQETARADELATNARTLSRLTGALLSANRVEGPALLVHPAGPLGSARAGMLIADLAPQMQTRVTALRAELAALRNLREARDTAQAALDRGMTTLTEARDALTEAAQAERGLEPDVGPDEAMLLALLESAQTLEVLSAGLGGLVPGDPSPAPELAAAVSDPSVALALPVRGRLLHRSAPLAGGGERPVLVLATEPGALVSSPVDAVLRYTGPLDDYGNVILLEPGEGYLLLMAGLDIVYAGPGTRVSAGAPLGLMPGARSAAADAQVPPDDLRFYLELRRAGQPIDPGVWFDLTGLAP